MKHNSHMTTGTWETHHPRFCRTLLDRTICTVISLGLLSQFVIACASADAKDPEPASESAAAPAAPAAIASTTVVTGADTAYYFDDADKLVAVEDMVGVVKRTIKASDSMSNTDGMSIVMKSTCQGGIPKFEGKVEMAGKASTVVYTVAGPSVLIVLAVEDLASVPTRVIEPMKALDEGGVCCCTARRCGGALCCPCKTNC